MNPVKITLQFTTEQEVYEADEWLTDIPHDFESEIFPGDYDYEANPFTEPKGNELVINIANDGQLTYTLQTLYNYFQHHRA